MDIRGSHDKLTDSTGWQPEIPFEQSIRDTLDWWRTR
jgi:GDP-4-dehydro-6-deoxy-D-mannose reductase